MYYVVLYAAVRPTSIDTSTLKWIPLSPDRYEILASNCCYKRGDHSYQVVHIVYRIVSGTIIASDVSVYVYDRSYKLNMGTNLGTTNSDKNLFRVGKEFPPYSSGLSPLWYFPFPKFKMEFERDSLKTRARIWSSIEKSFRDVRSWNRKIEEGQRATSRIVECNGDYWEQK